MNQEMKIALMESHSPSLLKKLDMGTCKISICGLFRNKIKIESDVLYKLESKAKALIEKGHEVIEPCYINYKANYCLILTRKPSLNSSYLKMKRTIEKYSKLSKEIKL